MNNDIRRIQTLDGVCHKFYAAEIGNSILSIAAVETYDNNNEYPATLQFVIRTSHHLSEFSISPELSDLYWYNYDVLVLTSDAFIVVYDAKVYQYDLAYQEDGAIDPVITYDTSMASDVDRYSSHAFICRFNAEMFVIVRYDDVRYQCRLTFYKFGSVKIVYESTIDFSEERYRFLQRVLFVNERSAFFVFVHTRHIGGPTESFLYHVTF